MKLACLGFGLRHAESKSAGEQVQTLRSEESMCACGTQREALGVWRFVAKCH